MTRVNVGLEYRFNPTLVRLRPPLKARVAVAGMAVSIPRWFD